MADKLIEIFADELMVDPSTLNGDSSPENTENWDSLANMRLVAAIEEGFNVRLSTGDMMKMRTIDIVRTVLKQKGVDIA